MSEIPRTNMYEHGTKQHMIAVQQEDYTAEERCLNLSSSGRKASETSDYLSPSSSCDSLAEEFGHMMTGHECEGFGADELPIFSLKSISPTSRSISPIDHETPSSQSPSLSLFNVSSVFENTPPPSNRKRNAMSTLIDQQQQHQRQQHEHLFNDDEDDLMTLEELHARIGTPSRNDRQLNLETIFEGVFLDTPPKNKYKKFTNFQKIIVHRALNQEEEEEEVVKEDVAKVVDDQQQDDDANDDKAAEKLQQPKEFEFEKSTNAIAIDSHLDKTIR